VGTAGTRAIGELLGRERHRIERFEADDEMSLLMLSMERSAI
jgi:hypothetical protein